MEKIKVEVCVGTTCFVLGASALQDLESFLPEGMADKVEVVGCTCLGLCKNKNYGEAPFVRIAEEFIVAQATVDSVIEALEKIVK